MEVKRKEVEEEEEKKDANKKVKVERVIRVTSESSSLFPPPSFIITTTPTRLGRNTPELKKLINKDPFVSREACSIVVGSDGDSAILSAVCFIVLSFFIINL